MSVFTLLRPFLRGAHQRLACDAVSFVSPSRDRFEVLCAEGVDAKFIRDKLDLAADTFLLECRNRRDAVLRNRVRFESGGPLIGRFLIAPMLGEGARFDGVVCFVRSAEAAAFDADDARQSMQLVHQLARLLTAPVDPLTELPTRATIEKLVELRLSAPSAPRESSILYGDLDQLHVINDLLGFEAGDRVIAGVAAALASELGDADAVLSRLSGDRFMVFLPGLSVLAARDLASRLRTAIADAPLTIDGESIALSMSFGAASVGAGERSFDHALAAAEVACKAAKDRGRNRVEAYQATDSSIIRRRDDIAIVGRLRSALDEARFQVFGQPIASLVRPEDIQRYEMLLRIVDEKGRLVLPGHFMSSATRYQLLPQIDRCVVSHVFRQLQAARTRPGFGPMEVSLNLSGPTISDPAFHDWLLAEIETSGIPGDWLTFELTETAAVQNVECAKLLMSRLGERGCRFALDDFGAGVSSLAHLRDMNFSILKIDGSFIRDIMRDERSQALVRAIAQLGRALGMDTVAEYVETPIICMRLLDLDVQYGQGHAIGKPRPLERILATDQMLACAS